ncbi:hypothetical protein [Ferruginibacter sp.]
MIKHFHTLFKFSLLLLIWSCNSSSSDSNFSVYRALSGSLIQSNREIEREIKVLQAGFERDTSNPTISYHAKLWLPKVLLIQSNSTQVLEYINTLKVDLKKEAGLKLVDMKEQWDENDMQAVDKLFKKMGKGEALKQTIQEYEAKVLAVDRNMDSIFTSSVNEIIRLKDPHQSEQKTFTKTFFTNIPAVAAFAILQKFENDIRNLEIQLITYCYLQIPR